MYSPIQYYTDYRDAIDGVFINGVYCEDVEDVWYELADYEDDKRPQYAVLAERYGMHSGFEDIRPTADLKPVKLPKFINPHIDK